MSSLKRPRSNGFAAGSVAPAIGLGIGLALFAGACDFNPLEQEAPSRVDADVLTDPSNAELLVRSAISDFECALSRHVYTTGLIGDELADGSMQEMYWDYDRRTLSPSRGQYASGGCGEGFPNSYMTVSSARFQADNALELLDGWTDEQVPERTDLIGQAATFGGYSLVLLGESVCSAALDLGPELTPAEILAEAVLRFDRAIAASSAAGNAEMENVARVGRARARLNLGDLSGAAEDAAAVSEGFAYFATYSDVSARRRNRVFVGTHRTPRVTVDESYRNLTFEGVPDPRVEVIDAGQPTIDADVPLFQAAKYSDASSPMRVASWEEAQLIIAESSLAAGDVETTVDIINVLHAQAGLPPYAGGTQAEVREHLIEERRREFFLEGQRMGDMIRYDLPLVPAPGTPFHRGGTYGDRLCMPLPDVERLNNPNL